MIKKMTNKDERFYEYMGKFFGSRLVQSQTNDRIYDDNSKEWYIYFHQKKVVAFISVNDNVIKNVYGIRDDYLEEILEKIKNEKNITYSIVTNCYEKAYKRSGFKVEIGKTLKNFVTICLEVEDNEEVV